MNQPRKMQEETNTVGDFEQQRAEFVRTMETVTPRDVLDAIEHLRVLSTPAPSEWPEFITQTHGACYASQE